MAIWQDLVSDHSFPHGYQTVKRFVRKLRGSESPQAVGIILTPAGRREPRSITELDQWCVSRRGANTAEHDYSC